MLISTLPARVLAISSSGADDPAFQPGKPSLVTHQF